MAATRARRSSLDQNPRGSDILRPMRAIPIARAARRKHDLEPIVGRAGTLDAADALAARRIAAQLTEARERVGEAAVSAGDVAALAALDAALHRLVEDARQAGRADLAATLDAVGSTLGPEAIAEIDREWRGQFRDGGSRAGRRTDGPAAARPSAPGPDLLAEVLVLAALNEDPAATGVRELVDDTPLRDRTAYERLVDEAERELGGRAGDGTAGDGAGKARRSAGAPGAAPD